METKYYTPEDEELHPDMDIEIIDPSDKNKEWKTFEIGDNGYEWFYANLDTREPKEWIRVKCLDRDDIESLGWVLEYTDPDTYSFKEYNLKPDEGAISIHVPGDYDGIKPHFKGCLKNKSELRKIMQFIRII